jgi:DNA polymerase
VDDRRDLLAEVARGVRSYLEIEQEIFGDAVAVTPRSRVTPKVQAGQPAVVAPTSASVSSSPQMQPQAALPLAPALPVLDSQQKRERLHVLAQEATSCTACALHEKRNRVVFARGSHDAEVCFVGEGPGRDEDQQGLPFVGAAGKLLDRMVAAMGYERDEVYICNVVKCRPPDNRTPRPEEAIACRKFLEPQIEAVAPKVIVALGRCAAENLGLAGASGPWRGRWHEWRGVPAMATYHPAFLLRSPQFKRTVWQDLQAVLARIGRTPPKT